MIKLLTKIPRKIYVACSGGVDSMAALSFLANNHEVTLAFFDHGTETSAAALEFLSDYSKNRHIHMVAGRMTAAKPRGVSPEEHWREHRYLWLEDLPGMVVTAHHLGDAVETWVWSSLHGHSRLPRIQRGNIMRPFLATPKHTLINFCQRNLIPWVEDASNADMRFTRNYIRHEMMPHVLKVNPGIGKMVKKRLLSEAEEL